MKYLLDGRLEPITSEFGFVRAPCEEVARWWSSRDARLMEKRGGNIECRRILGNLESLLENLLPLTSVERRRLLLVPTLSDWTAVFDNGWRGGDAAGLWLVASEIKCHSIRVVAVDDVVRLDGGYGRYGARVFEMYGPDRTEFLNYVRTIGVVNDGGRWRLDRSGVPLDGEQESWFSAPRVRDRFKMEHLDALLRGIGIRAFDESFFGSEGVLIERHGPFAAGCREYQLSEVQAEWDGSTSRS